MGFNLANTTGYYFRKKVEKVFFCFLFFKIVLKTEALGILSMLAVSGRRLKGWKSHFCKLWERNQMIVEYHRNQRKRVLLEEYSVV